MKQVYRSNAVAAAPDSAAAASEGNPALEDIANNLPATVIGAYWFYQVSKEIEAVITEGGLVPSAAVLTQLRNAIQAMIDAATGALSIPTQVELATNNEHTQPNPPSTKAATPAGVRAVRDILLDSPPGALDTLNELAAALGDDANFSATVMSLINARLSQVQGDARYVLKGGLGVSTGASATETVSSLLTALDSILTGRSDGEAVRCAGIVRPYRTDTLFVTIANIHAVERVAGGGYRIYSSGAGTVWSRDNFSSAGLLTRDVVNSSGAWADDTFSGYSGVSGAERASWRLVY